MPIPFDMEARFFSRTTGLRLAVNPDEVTGIDWELVEGGGTGQITLTFARPVDAAFAAQSGDTVEVWATTGETAPRCRGRITQPERALELKESLTLTAYGRMQDMNSVLLDKVLLRPGGDDLSFFAAQILNDYAARRGVAFARDIQHVGITLERLELLNATGRSGMDTLLSNAAGNVVWGWDIDPQTGLDRFYFRPKALRVGHQWFVGGSVRVLHAPVEALNIVNGLKIQGGPAKYPNLITNGSFENPQLPTESSGSLLQNGGFEQGNPGGDSSAGGTADILGWAAVNGATRNQHDEGSRHHASAHTGTWYVTLYHPGEEVWQAIARVTPLTITYRASLFCARESSARPVAGRLLIEGRSASDAVLETFTLPLTPASTEWTGGQPTTVLASDGLDLSVTFQNPGTVKARIRIVCDQSAGGEQGLLIDDVTFADQTAVGQVAWSTHLQNPGNPANQFVAIDWANRAAAYDGYYGVRLTVIADGGDRPALAPQGGDNSGARQYHFAPQPQQTLRIGCMARNVDGAATALRIEYREWAGDGHEDQFTRQDFNLPAGSGGQPGPWTPCYFNVSAHGDAATATLQATFGVSGTFDLDCFQARDAAAGTEFLRGTDFERYVTAEEVCAAGSDAANSVVLYGRREAVASVKEIVNWSADAIAYAVAYFTRNAAPLKRPLVELAHEPVQIPSPGDGTQVQISGLASADLVNWCARAQYAWKQSRLAISLELDSQRPTLAKLLTNLSAGSGGGSASAIGAVSQGASQFGSGVATPTPAYRSTLQASPTDATLHDNYRAGPHVADAERTAWNGTTAEVISGRTRTVKAVSFTTLEGRLDAMETDIAGAATALDVLDSIGDDVHPVSKLKFIGGGGLVVSVVADAASGQADVTLTAPAASKVYLIDERTMPMAGVTAGLIWTPIYIDYQPTATGGVAITFTPTRLDVYAETAPTGAGFQLDVTKNGVSILSGSLTLAAGATHGFVDLVSAVHILAATTFTSGDRLNWVIQAVNSADKITVKLIGTEA